MDNNNVSTMENAGTLLNFVDMSRGIIIDILNKDAAFTAPTGTVGTLGSALAVWSAMEKYNNALEAANGNQLAINAAFEDVAFDLSTNIPGTIGVALTGVDWVRDFLGKWFDNGPNERKLTNWLVTNMSGLDSTTRDLFNTATITRRADPLTLDLDGDGLETVGVSTTAPILFDHDGDGVKTSTGWVKSDDALLVRDINGNGLIDNGRELFGDSTIKSNGQRATDGFDALKNLDSNLDGIISNLDTQFANLRLWRDFNQDGISQSSELFTLTSQNIASINVASTSHSNTLTNGNQIADLGTFVRTNGTTGAVGEVTGNLADINLAQDTFKSQFTDHIPLTTQAQTLPDNQATPDFVTGWLLRRRLTRVATLSVSGRSQLQGAGQVRQLREAASLSPTLANLLVSFVAANDNEWRVIA